MIRSAGSYVAEVGLDGRQVQRENLSESANKKPHLSVVMLTLLKLTIVLRVHRLIPHEFTLTAEEVEAVGGIDACSVLIEYC